MRKGRTEKLYVKTFKILNNEGTFTKENFNLFQEKFDLVRKLYFNEKVKCDCYDSFRAITKEVKRAAHNANLKAELLHMTYESFHNTINISGGCLNDINLLVFIKPVKGLDEDRFTIVQVKSLSLKDNESDTTNVGLSKIYVPDYIYIGTSV